MILVVGGTGHLGSALVPLLAGDGERIRTMSRGTSVPLPNQADDGVERLRGGLASPADCARAVAGCRSVVFAASGFGLKKGGNPRTVDGEGAIRLIGAAALAGVEHVVLMSMYGAAPDAPVELLRMKAAAEAALRDSGTGWTVIRMGPNLEQFIATMSEPLDAKGRVMVFGSGRARITFTSTADAVQLVRRVLHDGPRSTTIEWGSETHTFDELAQAILARSPHASVQRVPVAALRLMAIAARPVSPFLARMAAASLWMESGAAEFDPLPARADYPDIPVVGLSQLMPRA